MRWTASLIGLILLLSWSLYPKRHLSQVNHLSEMREWALKSALWPDLGEGDPAPLIAVRQIYEIEQSQLRLKAYLLAPCTALCGDQESCARHCQSLILEWDGQSPDARLVIEGYDLKERHALGRVTLKQVAPIELRYWSRKQRLIALIQSHSQSNKTLQLIKLGMPTKLSLKGSSSADPSSADPSSKENSISKGQPPSRDSHRVDSKESKSGLYLYDQLSLGPYHGHETPLRGSVTLRDLDGDESVELIAPLESLVHLQPTPLFVPTPYRLTDEGLKVAPTLINISAPANNELRQWLVSVRPDHKAGISIGQLERLFSFGLLLCLKDQCHRADELIHYAYPQHSYALQLWGQLKVNIETPVDQPKKVDHRQNPFSVLNP